MKLIAGLGNYGANFQKTRHNIGFMAINELKNTLAVFSDWQNEEGFKAEIAEGKIKEEKIILAKPQTMMNLSGEAVKLIADFYKIPPQNIWVVHDDLDLPLGVLRVSENASSAGHKGVQSIIDKLGTKNFIRFRLGIHPIGQTFFSAVFKRLTSTQKFVLQKFSKTELPAVEKIIETSSKALTLALNAGLTETKNTFN